MRKKDVFIVNSIVSGYPRSKGKSYVGLARKALKDEAPPDLNSMLPDQCDTAADVLAGIDLTQPDYAKSTGFDIVNKGTNGDTTTGIRDRFQADVLDGQPDHMYILTGTNDFIYREATPSEAFANLEEMAEIAESRGIVPVYLTPLHVDAEKAECMWLAGFGISYPAVNRDVDTFSDLIRESGRLYVDLSTAYDAFANRFDDIDLAYMDGVHPMPVGHAFLASEILRFMGENREALGF